MRILAKDNNGLFAAVYEMVVVQVRLAVLGEGVWMFARAGTDASWPSLGPAAGYRSNGRR